ncbi:MAG: hypothetical protein HYV90_05110 [Candidatus Woesebacteria bacterium]|nr:MAG: hypothetical protein HYV90_05110 [Candidatus Woesebacteria bacterium]
MNSLASQNTQSWLSWFLRGLLIVVFLILFAKLIEVQIIKGDYYRKLSEENRIRHIPIPAPRGKIIARSGEVLAGNFETKKRVKFIKNGGFEITDDLTEASSEEVVSDYKRYYPLGTKAAHAIGYLTKAGDTEVGKINPECPEKGPVVSGTLVGRTGLEEEYQCRLLGIPGEELIEVNTQGAKIRSLGKRIPIPGQDINTTIDFGLQAEVASEMDNKKGAAIVTDPGGQILAFYSSPSFDPDNVAPSLTDQNLPLFNRVISGTFHPGSVFKPATAIAALQENVIDKNFRYNDTGSVTVSGFTYRNWYFVEYGRTEGEVDLTRAIARSTDTFFYKIGEMIGANNLAKWADTFGLNKRTGIDLPGETVGLIPTPEWKQKVKKEAWFLGNTYNMAIGQGDVAVTPIEINTYISAIADGGTICTPHFLADLNNKCRGIGIDKQNLDLVKAGMKEACSEGGTAYTFFDFPSKHGGQTVACKTGTAEVSADGNPHAWFTVFSPIDKPQIVATILFEKGGQGSQVAGPVARKIFDYYFAGLSTTQ